VLLVAVDVAIFAALVVEHLRIEGPPTSRRTPSPNDASNDDARPADG
jgi:hypothetical protein